MPLKRTLKLFFSWFYDWGTPIRKNQIVFVTRRNVPISGNLRVMVDALSENPDLIVYLFKEDDDIPLATLDSLRFRGIQVLVGFSLRTLSVIFSSEIVVLSHSARDAYLTHRKRGRRVVNLWHGVALKQIENLMPLRGNAFQNWYRRSLIKRNAHIYDAVIASNSIDRLVNSLSFGVPLSRVHATGLPRFEYLRSYYHWPRDLQVQRDSLLSILNGRRLVLYSPTFRDNGTGLADLLPQGAIEAIARLCAEHNIVFGIRPHPYRAHESKALCDGVSIIDMASDIFPESSVLLGVADVLIADYSSIWIDYLLTKKPILSYAPDREKYIDQDRGFIHAYHEIFPGTITETWTDMILKLNEVLKYGPTDADQLRYAKASGLFLPDEQYQAHETIGKCSQLILGR